MNVSFTRARSKLIIFGSRKTLKKAPLLSDFFALMEGKGWILPMPQNAPHIQMVSTLKSDRSLGKRVAKDDAENASPGNSPPSVKKPRVDTGLLKGRPILQDLVNEDA